MKKKIETIRIISGGLAFSILYSSCTPTILDERDIHYVMAETKAQMDGSIAVPISFKISEDDCNYFLFLEKLSKAIIENPEIALDFSVNPEKYLAEYNYVQNIDLDDGLLKFILALGDPDINNAIKEKNIKKYLSLCKERGLIDNIDFFNKEYYQSQIDNMINSESYTQILDSLNKRLETRTSGPPTYPPDPGMFPLVAYFAVLVAVSAVAAIGIAIVLLEAVEGPKNMSANPVGESVVNLWILKEGNDSLLNFDDEINRCIDSVIDFIKSEKPSYFNTLSEDYIREILKYNFINRR